MSAGFEARLGQLDLHAQYLAGHAEQVAFCADAGQPLSSDAYGLIGGLVTLGVTETETSLSDALDALAMAATGHGGGICDSATGYREVEQRVATAFRGGS